MNITYEDMLNLTWLEFDYLATGYEQRMQRNWDYVRNVMAMQANTMSKKKVSAKDIMTLPYIDTPAIGAKVQRIDKETMDRMMAHFKN